MSEELDLDDYRNAPSGDGPLAPEWKDKPHRLLYDLVEEAGRLRERVTFLEELSGKRASVISEKDDRIAALAAEVERLTVMNKRWKAAVEGLTPNGSEYVDDPEACADAIRARCQYPKQIIELREQVERLKGVRTALVEHVKAKGEEWGELSQKYWNESDRGSALVRQGWSAAAQTLAAELESLEAEVS